MVDWTEQYRPRTLSEVRGNNKARDQLREWAETWDDHRQAVILHGSPGVGKTSAAHALAADLDWPTIELNASDQRTADVIERVAGEAARSGTLTGGTGGRRLVIIDEADNLHQHRDRGGARAMTDLVKGANQPTVLIANEFYDMSRGLRNACETIEFRDVSARSIVPVLRDICRQEGVEFEESGLERIAEANSGDLRGAVNDLQALAETTERLTAEDVVTGGRDRETGIFDYLDSLVKKATAQEALESSYDVDETPDDLINWIDDNMPKDYAGAELADAYGALSDADRWLGRVRATQNYSFWRYAADAMTAGVAAARAEPKGGWTRYGPPSYWSKLGRSRATRDRRDYVARHVAETEGCSMATARREILPYLAAMTHHCTDRDLTVAMAARYDLDADHVAFVTGSGKDTNKVQSIVEDARELSEEEAVEHSGEAFAPRRTDVTADEASDADVAETENDDAGDNLDVDAGPDVDTDLDTDTAPDTDANTDADTGTDPDTDTDTDTSTDSDPGVGGGGSDDGSATVDDSHGGEEKTEADDQQSGLGDFA